VTVRGKWDARFRLRLSSTTFAVPFVRLLDLQEGGAVDPVLVLPYRRLENQIVHVVLPVSQDHQSPLVRYR
jgi:hypothetical protein